MTYLDPLFVRSELSMIENRFLRAELRRLRTEHWHARELLKKLVLENASLRTEARSVCEDSIRRRTGQSRKMVSP